MNATARLQAIARGEGDREFGLTAAQIALTLVLNGFTPETAKRYANEFSHGWGRAIPTDRSVDEVLDWAESVRGRES